MVSYSSRDTLSSYRNRVTMYVWSLSLPIYTGAGIKRYAGHRSEVPTKQYITNCSQINSICFKCIENSENIFNT